MKFSEAEGKLKNLVNQEVTIEYIVNIIKSIDSLQVKTNTIFAPQSSPYQNTALGRMIDPETGEKLVKSVRSMLVDFSYQRFLKLRALIKRLEDNNGNFSETRASCINVRVRTNGEEFIWDGLRRAVLSGLKDIWEVPVISFVHGVKTKADQKAIEAKDFSAYNGKGSESMRKEEVWKADYLAKEDEAIELGDIMKSCNLDILGVLQNGGWSLGGFAIFQSTSVGSKKIKSEYLEQSSRIIQQSFTNDNSVKGYLITGIAKYLETVDKWLEACQDGDDAYDCESVMELDLVEDALIEYTKDWMVQKTNPTQAKLISPSESNHQVESAAFNFYNKVVRPNLSDTIVKTTLKKQFIEDFGLDADNF
tara:strand:- start:174 stop:1265 length:1092 start_codon:yes stop_codon:yes gene_type:complete